MGDFTQYFLYIPGIVIFLLGSGQVRTWWSAHSAGAVDAVVLRCEHVVKKDSQGRDTFNYYNTTVEYTNPKTDHKEQHAIKTPTEYAVGQQVRLARSASVSDVSILDAEENTAFHPVAVLLGGALMILLALFQNQGKEVYAMICLAALLLGAGLCMIYHYAMNAKRKLTPVEAEIIDTYSRQISKSTKILRGDKFTYYPIVKYRIGGTENILRCHVNAESEKRFKIGDTITLYYDEDTKRISEQKVKVSTLIIGVILAVLGIAAGLSILSVLAV